MKNFATLVSLLVFHTLVEGHIYLKSPPSRGTDISGNELSLINQQGSGGYIDQYYYHGGAEHVCGNVNYGYANTQIFTQNTGPVRATYLSGQTVVMNVLATASHGGLIRLKLCKLNSPSDMATQDCFDQNILKISPISNFMNNPHNLSSKPLVFYGNNVQQIVTNVVPMLPNQPLVVDDYTIRDPIVANPSVLSEHVIFNMSINVQLPPGLVCDNCALLLEFKQRSYGSEYQAFPCTFANGTAVSTDLILDDGRFACPTQGFRSCADIKITKNPSDNAVYKPNPVKPVQNFPQTFQCPWNDHNFGVSGSDSPLNLSPDPYKFLPNASIMCFLPIANNMYTQANCDLCRLNCMTPDKICPSFCNCRWYPRTQQFYYEPLPLQTVLNIANSIPFTTTIAPKNLEYNGYVDVFKAVGYQGAFVGCFQDQIPRDMSNLLLDFNPNMTVELCAATCFKNGFKYAGLQAGQACFCDNSYGKYGYIYKCSTPCRGNSSQICGSRMINSVYNVSLMNPSLFSPYIGKI